MIFFPLSGCALNLASNSMDAWKAITDPDVLRDLKVTKPLLQVRLIAAFLFEG